VVIGREALSVQVRSRSRQQVGAEREKDAASPDSGKIGILAHGWVLAPPSLCSIVATPCPSVRGILMFIMLVRDGSGFGILCHQPLPKLAIWLSSDLVIYRSIPQALQAPMNIGLRDR
jgi:hypothetical protein